MGRYEAKRKGHWVPSLKSRAYVYGIAIAASPIAVGYGIVTVEESGLWTSLIGAALGINGALALRNLTNGDTNESNE